MGKKNRRPPSAKPKKSAANKQSAKRRSFPMSYRAGRECVDEGKWTLEELRQQQQLGVVAPSPAEARFGRFPYSEETLLGLVADVEVANGSLEFRAEGVRVTLQLRETDVDRKAKKELAEVAEAAEQEIPVEVAPKKRKPSKGKRKPPPPPPGDDEDEDEDEDNGEDDGDNKDDDFEDEFED